MRATCIRSILITVGLLASLPVISQHLFINEFLASNSNVLADEHGDFDDWVELFNPGPLPVDIGGWYVTDDLSKPNKWQIPATEPATTTVQPGGFLLLWFDREMWQGVLHVDAKLSADGEDIGLFRPDGTPVDALSFGPQTANISYGRMPDGGDAFQFFTTPTPGASNAGAPGGIFAEAPEASVAGGFFTNSFNVSLATATQGAVIRYTLDGGEPAGTDAAYQSPLPIAATTTLRARAFAPGMLPSRVTTHTYIHGPAHTFPVVALSFRHDDFFDPSTGIYPNYVEDWERPAHIEFFEEGGTLAFSDAAGVEIHGTGSAQLPQKSLRLKARANAGSGFFEYPIFPGLPFDRYKTFILRNSGQDWSVTMFRDAFVTSLVGDLTDVGDIILPPRLHLQAFRPGVTYLNGEYWGIHNIREHAKKNYIEQHFGLGEHETDLLDNADDAAMGDFDAWNFFIQYLSANDFGEDGKIQQLGSFLDLPHFLDYNVFNILTDNADWPGNNFRRWRKRTNHAQWRFLTFDLDLSFGLLHIGTDSMQFNTGDASANSLTRALDAASSQWPNPSWATLPFRKVMENQRFRRDFINRSADFLNVLFDPQRVNSRIDKFVALYQPEIQRHFDRWASGWNPWDSNVEVLRKFAGDRPLHVRQHYEAYFDEITGMATITLAAEPAGAGGIAFSTLYLPPDGLPWSGEYFTGVEIPALALPAPGYVFAGWSEPDMGNIPSADFSPAASGTLTAFFEKGSPSKDTIVINEINYKSPDHADSGDWIELFNPNAHDTDISGWVFHDESGRHFSIPAGTVIPAGGFLILAENAPLFSTVFPQVPHVLGDFGTGPNGFKLSNSGELIVLKNADLFIIDSVRYSDKHPWPTSPDGSGTTLQLIHWQLDNALPQSWKAAWPTPGLPNAASALAQTIDFQPIGDKTTATGPFNIAAMATSGLPVTFNVVAGPATINGHVVTLTGSPGIVTIRADQPGNGAWLPASPVFRSFKVTKKPVYCEMTAVDASTEWIERVQFGSIDHLAYKRKYGDFSALGTKAPVGQTLVLTLTPAFAWQTNVPQYFRAWIDFDQDGIFENGEELVLEAIGNGPVTAEVKIPASAVLGQTRMRVAMRRGQFPDMCENHDFGSVLDYSVVIVPDTHPPVLDESGDPTTRLRLSPNPADTRISAHFSTKQSGKVTVSVVSTLGVQVDQASYHLMSGDHLLIVDISALAAGQYVLYVVPEGRRPLAASFLKI